MASKQQATELQKVDRVVDVIDLVADDQDADPDDVACAALSKIRKRGDRE
jgi:hypothetical protein